MSSTQSSVINRDDGSRPEVNDARTEERKTQPSSQENQRQQHMQSSQQSQSACAKG